MFRKLISSSALAAVLIFCVCAISGCGDEEEVSSTDPLVGTWSTQILLEDPWNCQFERVWTFYEDGKFRGNTFNDDSCQGLQTFYDGTYQQDLQANPKIFYLSFPECSGYPCFSCRYEITHTDKLKICCEDAPTPPSGFDPEYTFLLD